MNTLKFGISFIDRKIDNLYEKGLYLFYDEHLLSQSIFIYELIQNNTLRNNSCLFITNYTIMKDNDLLIKKKTQLLEMENLTILEIPSYLKTIQQSPFEAKNFIEDLNIYIEKLSPEILIIQYSDLLFLENNEINSTTHAIFFNYLSTLGITVVADVSNLSRKNLAFCEKYATGIFDFHKSSKNFNHRLTISLPKRISSDINIIFSIGEDNSINIPKAKNLSSIQLKECKQLVIHSELKKFEKVFKGIFSSNITITYYEKFEDLQETKIDNNLSLVMVYANIENTDCFKQVSQIRKIFPLIKIIFIGSQMLPVHQKLLAIKVGADKFLSLPITDENLKNFINDLYHHEISEDSKILHHQILLVKNEFIKSEKFSIIYKNTLNNFIKDYTLQAVLRGEVVNFFKVNTSVDILEKIPDDIKINKNLLFISSYYFKTNLMLLLIYKNLTINDAKKILETLNSLPEQIDNDKRYNLSFSEIVSKIDYPLDETDIHNVINWIYND